MALTFAQTFRGIRMGFASALATAMQVASRHAVAVAKPTVHQKQTTALSLSALNSGDLLAVAQARAVILKAALTAHFADGGATETVDAPHKVADAVAAVTTFNATGIGTTLANLITWIGVAKLAIIAHGNSTGIHFASDTTSSGTGFSITTDPGTTQAHCNVNLNDIYTAFNAHTAFASVV